MSTATVHALRDAFAIAFVVQYEHKTARDRDGKLYRWRGVRFEVPRAPRGARIVSVKRRSP